MEMSTTDFLKLHEPAQASTFFSLRIVLYYMDIHMAHEREKCTPLRSYISRAVNVGAELKCLWECELMRGPLPRVLFYMPLMWNVCAMQFM